MKAIITYHSVDATGSVISLEERVFRRHVQFLASGRVRVVPLEALPEVPEHEDAVALTFDDGLASFGEIAAPLLLEHGLPVTLFVVADAVGTTNVWRGTGDAGIPVLRLLDWSELGRLADAGVSLGAHTCSHPHLTTLAPDAAEREIETSKSRLAAELGIVPATFAYPYGSYDRVARDAVARHFRYAVSTELRILAPGDDAALLPRLDSYYFRGANTLETFGSRRFRLRLALLARARNARRSLTRARAR